MSRKSKYRPYLETMPVVALLLFVLVFGILGAFVQSLGYFPFIGMKEITLEYYTKIFTNSSFLKSLSFTLYISAISSIIAVVLGIIIASLIVSLKSKKEYIYKIPIVVPHITVALFAITFLSDSGFFARILYSMGVKNAQEIFSNILFSSNGIGIILAYIWKETPYVMLTCLAVLKRLSSKHEMAAINLGASKWYAFRKVTLPMLLSTILSVFTIIFSFSFGSYEIPMLLGATVPKAIAVQAFIEYQNPMMTNRPYAMAMNMVIIAFCVLFVLLFNTIIKRIVMNEKN